MTLSAAITILLALLALILLWRRAYRPAVLAGFLAAGNAAFAILEAAG